jgi:hypothetical protein
MKKKVCLYPLKQLALIISEPSGVFYYNQVGGVSCQHPEEEGVLVFVGDVFNGLYDEISMYRYNQWEFQKKDADYLDQLFKRKLKFVKVDRTRLKDSMEAWIHVVFEHGLPKPNRDSLQSLQNNIYFSGFESRRGVLTWDNSD